MSLKRGTVIIDTEALLNNIDQIRRTVGDKKIFAVIKADAYGHGAEYIAELFEKENLVNGFCVATREEAVSLREKGIKSPILILGTIFDDDIKYIMEENISTVIYTEEMAKTFSEEYKRLNNGKPIKVHIKVDTGMSRIGLSPDDKGLEIVKRIISYEGIEVEGIMMHFSKADEMDKTTAMKQYDRFISFIKMCNDEGIEFKVRHCCNSAGIMELKDCYLDAVRAGIILYGLKPSNEVDWEKYDFKPAMRIESSIAYVKDVKKGTEISYGGTFVCDKDMKIATIPVGYADGYPRLLSNKGYVLINGQKARILGRVCMDQFMVDVTDIDGAEKNTLVTLMGKNGNLEITAEELGEISGRFNYELVCNFVGRMKRIFDSQCM